MLKNRDEILNMSDTELSEIVNLNFFKASGNGGQKRNKTSNAVRVTYEELGISVTDCSSRSQHDNRSTALKKLKIEIAIQQRVFPAKEILRERCSIDSKDYPLYIARVLDHLFEQNFDLKSCAEKLNISVSRLVKILYSDKEIWQLVQNERKNLNLFAIMPPK